MNPSTASTALTWTPDILPGCESASLSLPDAYDGPCVATLVRCLPNQPTARAVLYIHGFVDYFFQQHMAAAYNAHGYAFYALDLRRYGRSLLPHQYPNSCRDLREYYAEIDQALAYIRAVHAGPLLLNGHSTGGLLGALYANEGAQRQQIAALFLNSPFLDLNATGAERVLADNAARLGALLPDMKLPATLSPLYAQSIHAACYGEWHFDLNWKPIEGFAPSAGWLRTVRRSQRRVQSGLTIASPILIMHAARSHTGTTWSEDFTCADCVLDVAHMRRYGPGLGADTTLIAVEGGIHDLVLSQASVRRQMFAQLFGWLNERLPV